MCRELLGLDRNLKRKNNNINKDWNPEGLK